MSESADRALVTIAAALEALAESVARIALYLEPDRDRIKKAEGVQWMDDLRDLDAAREDAKWAYCMCDLKSDEALETWRCPVHGGPG